MATKPLSTGNPGSIFTRSKRISYSYDANVAKQFPVWGKGSIVRYWAERGLVHWEDSKDNSYGSMPWQDAGKRVLALSEMVFNSQDEGLFRDEIQKVQKFISDMEPIIRQAKEQGGPLDNMHQVAEAHRRRRPKIMPMVSQSPLEFTKARPAKNDPHKGPQLPKKQRAAKDKPRIIVP